MKPEPASKANYYRYNPRLKSFARELRKHPTRGEKILWEMLRNKRMLGYTFLRQRSVEGYVADFMCKELLLIVESDGITHELEDRKEKDLKRDAALKEIGFTTLRFKDWEIIDRPDLIYLEIKTWIEERINSISE